MTHNNSYLDVDIETISDTTVKISWNQKDTSSDISIFYGPSPEQINRTSPATTVSKTSTAEISGLDPAVRYYFFIAPKNMEGFVISQRRVRLDGSVNFRDLGG